MSVGEAIAMRWSQAVALGRGVRQPMRCYSDWLKLRRRPYTVETRDGLVMELRPGGGDRFAFYETVIRRDYLQGGVELKPGQTVIDIGANIGGFALVAAQAVGDSGRVIAVEPERHTFDRLERNIAHNGFEQVTALKLAVGGAPGETMLYTFGNPLMSSIVPDESDAPPPEGAQVVEVVTLNQLIEQQQVERCDLLKMDCEGAEYDIIDSLDAATAERIGRIVMETHPVEGRTVNGLTKRLESLGFEVSIGHAHLLSAWRDADQPT